MKVAIINGPNLNLLGTREPAIYGEDTLSQIQQYTAEKLQGQAVQLSWYQFNTEGEIVETLHQLAGAHGPDVIVINPAAFSHTSVAIVDALKLVSVPVVEVHLSNTHGRETYRRQQKLTAMAATVVIEGAGKDVYYLGILSQLLKFNRTS